MNNDNGILTIKNLTVTFSRWGQTVNALNEVSIVVPEGQWLIIVGLNGSGKTTFLSTISTRIHPKNGQILFRDEFITNMSNNEIANKIFHVHQDPLLGTAPILTIFENLIVADHQAHLD